MSGRLERRYRRLPLAYPAAYRTAHGDEIISPVDQPWVIAVKAGLEVGLVLAVLGVAVAVRDPRPPVALAVFLTPGLFLAAEDAAEGGMGRSALVYWSAVALLTVGLLAVGWRARRTQLGDQ